MVLVVLAGVPASGGILNSTTTLKPPNDGIDGKRYPGLMCETTYGSNAASLSSAQGRAYNGSAVPVSIVCPIIKDYYHSRRGLDTVEVMAYVNSTPTRYADRFRCWLHATNASGSVRYVDFESSPSRGYVELTLTLSKSTNPGVYYLECKLPAYSSLVRYSVRERQT